MAGMVAAASWPAALLGCALKGLVLVGLGAVASLALRRVSAAARHLAWVLTMVGLVALPLVSAAVPSLPVPVPVPDAMLRVSALAAAAPAASAAATRTASDPAGALAAEAEAVRTASDRAALPAEAASSAGSASGPADVDARSADVDARPADVDARSVDVDARSAAPATAGAAVGRLAAARRLPSPATLLLLLWAAGAAVVLGALALGAVGVQRLERRTRPVTDRRRLEVAARAADRVGLRRGYRLLEVDGGAMPMTWGIRRATVLLPAQSASWSAARLESVLLHELAHLRRRDHLAQLVGALACAIHWFDPAVWIAARRLRIEREHACDDAVLAAGSRASDYAAQLLDVARSLRASRSTSLAAMAMARPTQLAGRLLAVLDAGRPRAALSRRRTWLAVACAVAVVLPLAAMTPRGPSAPVAALTPAARSGAVPGARPEAAASGAVPGARPEAAASGAVPGARSEATPSGAADIGAPAGPGGLATAPLDESRPAGSAPRAAPGKAGWPDCHGESQSISVNSHDDRQHIAWKSDACDIEVWIDGDVRFTDDFGAIASISKGGSLKIDATEEGVRRRLEVKGDGARLAYDYSVGGHPHAFDAEARQWLAAFLTALPRETGFGAEQRIASLLRSGGPDAVIAEARGITSDYVMSLYLRKLLAQEKLSDARIRRVAEVGAAGIQGDHELAELLIAVSAAHPVDASLRPTFLRAAGTLQSDYEHGRVLKAVLAAGGLTPEDVAELLRSAGSIRSDYEQAEVLVRTAAAYPIEGPARAAYVAALKEIGSDYERGRAVKALTARGGIAPEDQPAVIDAVRTIGSDFERAEALIAVAPQVDLSRRATQDAFIRAAAGIGSDYEQARVLRALLQGGRLAPESLAMILVSARSIDSDNELAELLLLVTSKYRLTGPLRDAFMKTLDGVGSSYEHDRVAAALLAQERG